jgi:signal peptidase I
VTSKPAREYKGVATKKGSSSASGSLLELIMIVAVALGLALGIQAFLVKPYRIPSESMVPTLQIGQRVLVNRIGARFGDPSVGDVVVFHPPVGAEQGNQCGGGEPPSGQVCLKESSQKAKVNFIKRVVAGPGDRIAIRNGHVVRNGKVAAEPFAEPCGGADGCDFRREVTVPADHYFMMGDNRGSSDDSRFWGPVPRKWIIGQAFATYWPPKRIGTL